MKIRVRQKSYEEVLKIPPFPHRDPVKQSPLLRKLVQVVSGGELKQVHFACSYEDRSDAPGFPDTKALLTDGTPCLFLMNHSCFTDLMIAGTLLAKKPYHIVCTVDGFVGKDGLMRHLGCIPTKKFTTDLSLVRDMVFVTKELKESVLMYPEASYTFDGTATPPPKSLAKCLKLLKAPVVMIRTEGAFLRDPLYNCLQKRNVTVTAKVSLLLTPEEIRAKSPAELNAILKDAFTFDGFQWQKDNRVRITEPFRADGLERVLYKCPICGTEGKMLGKGIRLHCGSCGADWELDEYGCLIHKSGSATTAGGSAAITPAAAPASAAEVPSNTTPTDASAPLDFSHVPDWYRWERECVRKEIADGTYRMELPVKILALVNTDAAYEIGTGTLLHTPEGFHLTGCGGALDYRQPAAASYSLYADYFWYEIGDMICIGNTDIQYYCFPQLADGESAIVAKARIAAEELFKNRES